MKEFLHSKMRLFLHLFLIIALITIGETSLATSENINTVPTTQTTSTDETDIEHNTHIDSIIDIRYSEGRIIDVPAFINAHLRNCSEGQKRDQHGICRERV